MDYRHHRTILEMERIINTINCHTQEDYFCVLMHLKFINRKHTQEPLCELPDSVSQTYHWHKPLVVDNITPVIFKKIVSKQCRYKASRTMNKLFNKKIQQNNRELKNNVYLNP